MISLVRAQLLFRRGRLLATLVAVAIAVASFSLLASAARSSRLEATNTVQANFRPLYDILVRPATAPGPRAGALDSDQIASTFGGITTDQWRTIVDTPEVAVAAPVAMIGYLMQSVAVPVDLSSYLQPGVARQVLRIQPTYVTDQGRTSLVDGAVYFYATENRLEFIPGDPVEVGKVYADGTFPKPSEIHEHAPDGTVTRVCEPATYYFDDVDALRPSDRMDGVCWSSDPTSTANRTVPPQVTLYFSIPMLLAAVDPAQEASLDRLDGALQSGRYLSSDDHAAGIPVLAANRLTLDEQLHVAVQRLPEAAVTEAAQGGRFDNLIAHFDGLVGTNLGGTTTTAQDVYPRILDTLQRPPAAGFLGGTEGSSRVGEVWTVGPAALTPQGNGYAAGEVPYSGGEWGQVAHDMPGNNPLPIGLADTPVRGLIRYGPDQQAQQTDQLAFLRGVGVFDPTRVDTGPALARAPFDLYAPRAAPGSDDASRKSLGGNAMLPNTDFAGLLGQQPTLLTSLSGIAALRHYTDAGVSGPGLVNAAPISMVRVRVAGDVGLDKLSQERVRALADRIRLVTGLQVDLTVGSSATGVPVAVPAGKYGRPALTVDQSWLKLGVATVIVAAVDRKSLILAILVLVACALAVGNAAGAAVRTRTTELGVLACLGWPRWRLFLLVLTESLVVGAVAGVLGTILALALSPPLGVHLDLRFALLAVPAALVLSLLAALVPAWRATRADPAAAVRPQVALVRRKRVPRSVRGLAFGNVLRSPGRTAVGALSLAIGVASLGLLLIVNLAFRGTVSGTVLGDAITVQVQAADYIAAALTTILGAATVADVLYVNIRERAGEFALLGAAGWPDGPLARLAGYEALVLGLLGAVVGAGAALGTAAWLSGGLPAAAYIVAAGAALGGTALTVVAAILPVRSLRSLPTARLLAEE